MSAAGTSAGGAAGGAIAAAGAGGGGTTAAGGTDAGNAGAATGGGQAGQVGSGGQAGSAAQAGAGGQAGSAATVELHITTSNIRYGTADDGVNAWDKRKALLFQVLHDQAFDTAGLQEALVAQLADFDTAMPEYGRVGVGRNDGKTAGEYSAILYLKARYEVVDSGTFWLSDTPEVPGSMTWGNTLPRICTWARFKNLQTGLHYYHYNLHLDNVSQPSREKSAQLVAARIAARVEQSERVILTGDFNAVPSDLAVTYLLGTENIDNAHTPVTLIDAWLLLHPADPASNTFHSFNGGTSSDSHIDYIMFGTGVTAKSAEIIRTHDGAVYPSDHYPVSAVFELAP
jgi:endonuclease/exonuclease/phosphatase family metal-dependent hydrolase